MGKLRRITPEEETEGRQSGQESTVAARGKSGSRLVRTQGAGSGPSGFGTTVTAPVGYTGQAVKNAATVRRREEPGNKLEERKPGFDTFASQAEEEAGFRSWLERMDDFSTRTVESSKARQEGYTSAQDMGTYRDRALAEIEALTREGAHYQRYFQANQDRYQQAGEVAEEIGRNREWLSGVREDLGEEFAYWDQFGSEEEYRQVQERAALEELDQEGREQAMAEAQAAIEEAGRMRSQAAAMANVPGQPGAKEKLAEADKALEEAQARVALLEELEAEAQAETYRQYMDREDWEELSAPGASKVNPNPMVFWDRGDERYDYINDINGARAKGDLEYAANSSAPEETVYLARMTGDEVGIYNYLYAKEGRESADRYVELLLPELERRAAGEWTEHQETLTREHPVLMSAMSVPVSVLGGAAAAYDLGAQNLNRALTGKAVNYDSPVQQLAGSAETIRGTIAGDLEKNVPLNVGETNVPAMLYETLMSGADSLAAGLAGATVGGVMLGASAASSTARDVAARGGTDDQALVVGLAAGVFEMLFERVSLGNLQALKEVPVTGVKDVVMNVAKSMGVNASEEMATELANIVFDAIAMGDISNWELSIRNYMAQGLSREEAATRTAADLFGQVLEAGVSGGLMGAGFGLVGSIQSGLANRGASAGEGTQGGPGRQQRQSAAGTAVGEAPPVQTADETEMPRPYRSGETRYAPATSEADRPRPYRRGVTPPAESESRAGRSTNGQEAGEIRQNGGSLEASQGNTAVQPQIGAEMESEILQNALREAQRAGVISSRTAQRVMENAAAMAQLEARQGNVVSDSMTKAQRRQAVRDALTQMARSAGNPGAGPQQAATAEELAPEGLSLPTLEETGAERTDQTEEPGGLSLPTLEDMAQEESAVEPEGLSLPTLEETERTGNNGQQKESAGAGADGGGTQRLGGPGAGEQVGGLGAAAGTAQQREARAERLREARERQNRVNGLRLTPTSAKELGISTGTESRTVIVVPETAYDDAMRARAQRFAREGYHVTYFTGLMQVEAPGGRFKINGAVEGDRIFIQADNMRWSIDQIGEHEWFHVEAAKDPGLVQEIRDQIRQRYSREEFDAIVETYMGLMDGLYTQPQTGEGWEEAVLLDILEEIFADAYAGKNAFEAGATQYAESVREITRERAAGRTGETAEARGPPEERYSFAGRNAATANSETLGEAERLEMQGVDPEDIRQETGWFRGADGLWRFEIDDSGMSYSKWGDMQREDRKWYNRFWMRKRRLSDYIRHDELFENYPQLRQMRLRFAWMPKWSMGMFDGKNIVLNKSLRDAPEDTLVHEIQHAIQQYEGFASGSSVGYWHERMQRGYDARKQSKRQEEEELQAQIDSIRENEPEFFQDVMHLKYGGPESPMFEDPEYTEESRRFDEAWEEEEYRRFDEAWNEALEKYGFEKVEDLFDMLYRIEVLKEEELQAQVDSIRENEPEFFQDMMRLKYERPSPKLIVSEDMKAGQEYTPEWKKYNKAWDEALGKYEGKKILDLMDLMERIELVKLEGNRYAFDLYWDTAGEIEARDVAARRTMTAEQRSETRPDTGNEDTVFAEIEDWMGALDQEYGPKMQGDQTAAPADTQENIRRVASMEPVASITGEEFRKGDTDLITQVEGFFAGQGNRAYNPQLGEVVLDRRGVKSDIGHGIGRKKAAAFAAVPEVIAQGQVVDYQENWKERGYDTAVIAAPIQIGGQPYLAGVVVLRSRLTNRFYLHEVLAENDGAAPFKTGAQSLGEPGGDTPSVVSILGKIRDVKHGTERTGPANKAGGTRYSVDEDREPEWLSLPGLEESETERDAEPDWTELVTADESTGEYDGDGKEPEELSLPRLEESESGQRNYREELEEALLGRPREEAEQGSDLYRPEGMSDEDYEKLNSAWKARRQRGQGQEAAQGRPGELIGGTREDFTGTEALEKLGIKIENSVGLYEFIPSMIAASKAAKEVRKETRKAERRLGATEKERNFAAGIAAGLYTEGDIPSTMDTQKVLELADYYWAESAVDADQIRQRRADISRELGLEMRQLFAGTEGAKTSGALVLNNRTPTRNMLHMFGAQKGAEINRVLFDPVDANEAERIRFVNRMHDEVRTFTDGQGKTRELTREERALTQKVIEGKAVAEIVAGMEMREAIQNAAHNLKKGESLEDTAREFSLGKEEREMAQRYSRWLETQEALEKADSTIVEAAAQKYSQMFDQFYDAINDFLVAHGYEPIGYIKGYAPHIQPESQQNALSRALKAMGMNTDVKQLPTSIAGLTADYKPNKRWDPYFLQRTGDLTEYDIAAAFESYVDYMSDVIYHTDDIMRVRAAVQYFRKTYAPEEIRNSLEQADELRYAETEQKANFLRDNEVIDRDTVLSPTDVDKRMEEYREELFGNIKSTTKFSDLVQWMENYANILAGKQSFADRGWESDMGRQVLNTGNRLVRTFARAQVAGNISSALNQSAQLPQIVAELGLRDTAAAIADMAGGKLRKAEWYKGSDFLVGKNGVQFLTSTPGEMVIDAMFTPAQMVDGFSSALAVRGKYLKEIRAGKSHQEAMRAADRFARSIMGSRTKGSRPLAYDAKNPLTQMAHVFQLEVVNQWEHLTQDLPRDFEQIRQERGKGAAAGALAGVIVKALVMAFLLNRGAEELYGGTPAPFDLLGLTANFIASGEGLTTNQWLAAVIDNGMEELTGERVFDTDPGELGGEFDLNAAMEDTVYNVSNEIPFLRNVSALLGLGDETLPMPDLAGRAADITSAATEDGVLSGEMAAALFGLATEVLPGGRQLDKTAQGLEALVRGGRYRGYGEDARLQNPVEGDFWSAVRAMLFGANMASETREFYAAGQSGLSAGQTQVYESLVEDGADAKVVYDTIQNYREIHGDDELEAYERGVLERQIFRNADLTDQQKLELYRGITGADSRADKFDAMMQAGLEWEEVMDAYDKYAELDHNETMKAGEKATELAKWTDRQPWPQAGKEAVKEQLEFWVSMPAEASKYEEMTSAGLDVDEAEIALDALGELEEDASTVERYMAVAEMPLSESDKQAVMSTVMSDSAYEKYSNAVEAGISTYDYCTFLEDISDISGEGKQERVWAVIDAMDLTRQQKDLLHVAAGYKETTAKNAPWN